MELENLVVDTIINRFIMMLVSSLLWALLAFPRIVEKDMRWLEREVSSAEIF